jgi:hypothetical protein
LIDAYEGYRCFGEVKVEGLKLEGGEAISFHVKLKKTDSETFKMLKNAYCEECLSTTDMFEWRKKFCEERESLQDEIQLPEQKN